MKYTNFKRYKFSTIFKNINFKRYSFTNFFKFLDIRRLVTKKIYKYADIENFNFGGSTLTYAQAGTGGVGDTITDQNNTFLGDGLGSSIPGHMSTNDYIRIENDTNNSNANNFQCLRIRDVNRSRITLDHKDIVTVSGSAINGGATNMQVLIKPVFTYADNAVRISDASFFLTKKEGNDSEDLLDEIYQQRNNAELKLLDKNDYFLLYEIKNLEKVLPSLESEKFLTIVRDNLYERNKYDVHTDLMKKIQKKEFTNDDFFKLSKVVDLITLSILFMSIGNFLLLNEKINSIIFTKFFFGFKIRSSYLINKYLLYFSKAFQLK